MDMYRRSGIVTGILFIAADAAGFLTFVAKPFLDAPDFLARIPANEPAVLAGALLVLIMGWADAGIGISMYPVLRRHNEGIALGAAAFRIIDGVFVCIGAVLILLLVTLGRQLVTAGPDALSQFQNLGTLLREGRTWVADVAALPAWCIGAFLYYALFFKTRLVPRWLSVWGLAGIILTMTGSMLVLFRLVPPRSTIQILMYMPVAVQEIVLGIWLIVRGFNRSAAASRGNGAS